ncbi:MAG TPA: arginine repressor [Bacteroidota bacterium]|nr:arginine repressor [Bacteroidota bacterium]
MTKKTRHFAIKEILSTRQIASQDELRLELRKKGFDVTQATLSRDLKQLGVGRISSGEGAHYTLQEESEVQILRPVVGAQVVSMTANESLIVIRTLPGCANAVGEFLDAQHKGEIIGTIAGDNTLLVIPQSQSKTKRLMELLRGQLIEGEQ